MAIIASFAVYRESEKPHSQLSENIHFAQNQQTQIKLKFNVKYTCTFSDEP